MGIVKDPDYEDRWGATLRGQIYEAHVWEPALRAAFGDKLIFAGADQQTFVSDYLSATPDGLVITNHDGTCVLVECKTADPRTRLAEAKPEHVYQVQVQMGLVAERTNYRPLKAIISYTDTSFFDETKEFEVQFDPSIYSTAKERAATIMTATSMQALKPEGYIAGGRECSYCPFTTACGRARAEAVPKVEGAIPAEQMNEIKEKAFAVKVFKEKAADYEQMARSMEHAIKDALTQIGSKKAVDWEISVSWSAVKGRPSFNMKGLRAAAEKAGVDLSQFETVGDPADRLTITIRADKRT
jgi:CRISPR/Cas system-associated exonuclease Cas4 (RecB family)